MTSRFKPFALWGGVLLAACLGGCLGPSQRHGSNVNRRPSMPTIAPMKGEPVVVMPESAIRAAAMRAAGDGEIDGVVQALLSARSTALRVALADEIISQSGARDPRFAAQLALTLVERFERMRVIEPAARNLVQQDPAYALRWTADLPPGMSSRQMTRAVMDELMRADPRSAIVRIEALPRGSRRDELMVLAAAAWARRDPDAAIAWLGEFPDPELKPRLTSSVGFEVAQRQPERAVEMAEMLPEGRDRWLLYSAIAQTWVAVDVEAAHAWAGRLPAGQPREAALAGVDTGLGVPTSRRIASAPGIRGGGGRTRGGTAAVTSSWPEIDSPAFAAWMATQPRGMSREEAVLEYVRQRAALEPGAIGPLIASLPLGYTRDQATEIYLDGLLTSSPLEAARWVRSLPRSERTNEVIERTARRWLQTNPDAAAEWLEQSTLPTERKQQLLRDAGR